MSERRAKRVLVNRHLLAQTSVDSGSLTMLGVVIHRFDDPGEYMGVVEREAEARSFRLRVDDSAPAMQANIDLATLGGGHSHSDDCGCKDKETGADPTFVVNPAGYVVFHVSSGLGGYIVRVGRLERPEAALFDSTQLEGDDLFAVTLIRPGTYSVRNVAGEARGEIVVSYPKVGEQPHRPGEPVDIVCTEKAFRPARIRIQAAQGQLYRFRTPSRIAIELVEPDDGPKRTRPKGPGRAAAPKTRPKA
jgi:hypothetical protein